MRSPLSNHPPRLKSNRPIFRTAARLCLHTVARLEKIGFKDYSKLGVLINGDEELGSPGSGAFITQLDLDR